MEQFYENSTEYKEIKIVKGIIKSFDNEMTEQYDLFYWANFIPHFRGDIIKITGECGFDTERDRKEFMYEYCTKTDIVSVLKPYRKALCNTETYNKHRTHIYYENEVIDEKDKNFNPFLPWIRFPRSKDGVFIPELIERIFGRIPNKISFQ
jgi:hypothetical protein